MRDAQSALTNFRRTCLVSLKAYDDTGAIRIILYTNKFLDLPIELIEQLGLTSLVFSGSSKSQPLVSSEEAHQILNNNRLLQKLAVGSVLSMESATTLLLGSCSGVAVGSQLSRSLHIVVNLDSKYAGVQVYNKREDLPENADENNLADFLSDMPEAQRAKFTGENGQEETAAAALVSNYELVVKNL